MKLLSGITKIEKNDEWYTPEQTVALMYKLLQPKPNSTIICPFDTAVSHFVKYGIAQNYNILHNMTDWLTSDYEYDYLITNPPFSIKDKASLPIAVLFKLIPAAVLKAPSPYDVLLDTLP